MCIPLSGHGSDCCTLWELVVCLCCGFCSPHLESFQLLVCVICIKHMKGVSVKTQVFVKPFLKPQTCWLFGDSCLRVMQERDRKSPCWPSLSSRKEWQCPFWNKCWDAGLNWWKRVYPRYWGRTGKSAFSRDLVQVGLVFILCWASVLSFSQQTRVLSTGSLKWKWFCRAAEECKLF